MIRWYFKQKIYLREEHFCIAASFRRSWLIKHIILSHEGKTLPCDECEYMATSAARLKAHNNLRHSDGKVQCQYCPARLAKGRRYTRRTPSYIQGYIKSPIPPGQNIEFMGKTIKWGRIWSGKICYKTWIYIQLLDIYFYIKLITMKCSALSFFSFFLHI